MPILRPADRLGVVYTPPDVATSMVRVALEPLLRGKRALEIAALRVCDFAVGEGAFVVAAIEVIAEALQRAWTAENVRGTRVRATRIAAGCVNGVDIDARAIDVARTSTGCAGLRVADALALDWRTAFPEVFERGGFDAVIGNPPYVRQEQLVATKRALGGWTSATGVADLYVYFLELAHRLLRPGGRYCVITPNKWLTVEYGRGLRGFLAAQRSVEGVVDLARLPVFAGADAFPCITWGSLATISEPRGHRAITGDVATALRDPGVPLAISDAPWHIDEPRTRALIEQLERTWPALDTLLSDRPARGIVTGFNRAFVIDRETRARLIARAPESERLIRPFLKGRDIRRWHPTELDRWILLIGRGTSLDDQPAIAGHLAQFRAELTPKPTDHRGAWAGRKPGAYRWFELQDPVGELAAASTPRLVYQDIQTGPACALIDGGVVPDTTVWILPTAARYLLAVLNSSLYGWYARQRFPPALNGSVRPKLQYMRALPIAQPSAAERRRIEQLVEQQRRAPDAELDRAIDDAVLDVYQLDRRDRVLVRER